MIDTHSHIYDGAYSEDFQQVVDRAREAGVEALILPDIDCSCRDAMLATAEKLGGYAYPCIGLHPTSVAENWKEELQAVFDRFSEAPFCALGEIGLDEYWSKDFREQQMEVFAAQLNLAYEKDLPVIIHSRDATEDIFEVLGWVNKPLRGVFHAFSGSYETYCRIKKYGDFSIGIGGVVTFKNAHIAQFLNKIPMSDILLETDAPWLTPVPFRGRRNESSYIKYVAQKVAELYSVSLEQVDEETTAYCRKLFAI